MKYVYLIRSQSNPRKTYIGITENFRKRLKEHNDGKSRHTSKWPPWEMVVCIALADDGKASLFEEYLKVGSGQAFAQAPPLVIRPATGTLEEVWRWISGRVVPPARTTRRAATVTYRREPSCVPLRFSPFGGYPQ